MKFLIMTFLSAVSFNALAMNLECSSANGDVRVSGFRNEGGARPPVGMETSREAWSYKGVNVGTSSYLEGMPSGAVTGRLGRFEDSTMVIIDDSKSSERPQGTTVYTVKVKAPVSDAGKQIVQTFVLCKKTFATVPRP